MSARPRLQRECGRLGGHKLCSIRLGTTTRRRTLGRHHCVGAVGSEERTQGAAERETSKVRIRGGVDLARLGGGGARARGPCKLGDHGAVGAVARGCGACTTSCARRGRRCWEHVLRGQWNPTVGSVVCAALQILKEPLEVRCGVDGRKAGAAGGAKPLEILVASQRIAQCARSEQDRTDMRYQLRPSFGDGQ